MKIQGLLDRHSVAEQDQAMAFLRARYPRHAETEPVLGELTPKESHAEYMRGWRESRREVTREVDVKSPSEVFPHTPDVSLPGISNGSKRPRPHKQDAVEILGFLNEKAVRTFRAVDTNLKLIEARLGSGVTVQQCRGVIARKVREWKNDPKMNRYLRPATLFCAENFENYLGEREPDGDEHGA